MEAARPATEADLESVIGLVRQAIDELRPNRGGAIWSVREAHREPIDEVIEAAILDPGDQWLSFVGTIDGAIVGYALAREEHLHDGQKLVVIDDLYVEPDARGVGVGEALMNLVVEAATERGAVGVDALALPGDRHTKNFFESFGLKARAILVHRAIPEGDAEGSAVDDEVRVVTVPTRREDR